MHKDNGTLGLFTKNIDNNEIVVPYKIAFFNKIKLDHFSHDDLNRKKGITIS